MNVAVYLRKSRAEEAMDTVDETLAKHKKVLYEYAKKNRLNIVKAYEEVISGESLFARPQMLQLLEDVESEKYDAVLCMDIDRLGRGGMKDQGIILDTFKYSETKIITPEKIYNLNDESDEELTEFKTFMSRREYKIITKRLKRGVQETIKSGGFVGVAPFGYEKTVVDKKPTLKIVENEAYFVRMAFEMYAKGFGMTIIANKLNELGATPRRSEAFRRTSIRHMLNNNAYIGKIVWNKTIVHKKGTIGNDKCVSIDNKIEDWIIVDGMHEAIISEDLFNKCKTIMSDRYIAPSHDGTTKSSLAGIVVCKKCGMNMQKMAPYHKIPYLLCNTKGCCAGVKFGLVEDSLYNYLKDTLAQIKIEISQNIKADTSNLTSQLDQINKQKQKILQQKNKLYELLELEVYDVATFHERLKSVEQQIVQLEQLQKQIDNDIKKSTNENKKILAEKLAKVVNNYYSLDAQDRNLLLKGVIEKVYYTKLKGSAPDDLSLEIILKSF